MHTSARQSTHPYKLTMWLSLVGLVMYFGALTSAYIVKRAQANWLIIELPDMFWVSSVVIVLSSVTIFLASRQTKQNQLSRANFLLAATAVLGCVFISTQLAGFRFLLDNGVHLEGNVAGAFIYIIAWSHLVHVMAGIVGIAAVYVHQLLRKQVSVTGVSVLCVFWHFIDVIWLYLLMLLYFFR